MTQTSAILDDSRSVKLNASGTGSVTFGPNRPNTQYQITNIAVDGDLNTKPVAKARVYVGSTMIAGTYDGNQDSTDLNIYLYAGQTVIVTFEDGKSGDTYTAHFHGTEINGWSGSNALQ